MDGQGPVSRVARVLLVAVILAVAGFALCQTHADHTGFIDPCVSFLATIAVGWGWSFSLPLAGHSLPARAHAYNLHSPELTAPPPEA